MSTRRGPCEPFPIVLDAGALIALERPASGRRMIAVLERIRDGELHALIPAGVVGQAWRGTPRQARLARLVNSKRHVTVVPLDVQHAKAVGELLRRSETSDVVDAHVVLVALAANAPVITTDPDDLRAIGPSVALRSL